MSYRIGTNHLIGRLCAFLSSKTSDTSATFRAKLLRRGSPANAKALDRYASHEAPRVGFWCISAETAPTSDWRNGDWRSGFLVWLKMIAAEAGKRFAVCFSYLLPSD